MRRLDAPAALAGQADTFALAAAAAARWFKSPSDEALTSARTSKLRAAGFRDELVKRRPKGDGADLSFALREAAEQTAAAVVEAARQDVPADRELAAGAKALAEGAKALAAALAATTGEKRADALVEAKRWAGECERLRRDARAKAHDDPRFVAALAREKAADRLSRAAEALQQAADALGAELS
jgi:hypothetical protein